MALTLLLLLFAEETKTSFTADAQFWATVLLIATFVTDMLRRIYQERIDRLTAKKKVLEEIAQRELEKTERLEAEEIANKEREKIAAEIKAELEFQHEREEFEREKQAAKVIEKLSEQDSAVKSIDEKIVTLQVADEHKNEITEAIKENTAATKKGIEATKEGTEAAHQAYEVANTINQKLDKQAEAGLLNQEQKNQAKEIDEVEKAAKEKKSGNVEPDK